MRALFLCGITFVIPAHLRDDTHHFPHGFFVILASGRVRSAFDLVALFIIDDELLSIRSQCLHTLILFLSISLLKLVTFWESFFSVASNAVRTAYIGALRR